MKERKPEEKALHTVFAIADRYGYGNLTGFTRGCRGKGGAGMKLSLTFHNPRIASVGEVSKEFRATIGIPDHEHCIAVVWPDDNQEFTIPEVLRAAADWYEKSEK